MKLALISKSIPLWSVLPIAITCIGLAIAVPALAQERLLRTLTVTGRGVENIDTTLTQVRLGVEAQGKTAEAVQQEVARRSSAVVTLLRSRKVDKLETTGINLSPTYNYEGGRQTLTGYTASNMVSFQIPTPQVGTLLDEAVKAGASRIDGLSFMASDAAIADAQKQALREATQDAQSQADAVFSALNITRREVVSIQVNGAGRPPVPYPVPVPMMAEMKAGAAPSTPVIGGEQKVEATVTLTISY